MSDIIKGLYLPVMSENCQQSPSVPAKHSNKICWDYHWQPNMKHIKFLGDMLAEDAHTSGIYLSQNVHHPSRSQASQ